MRSAAETARARRRLLGGLVFEPVPIWQRLVGTGRDCVIGRAEPRPATYRDAPLRFQAMEPHVVLSEDGVTRCWWGASTADYTAYHDGEWGFPVDDDHLLFEKLSLEGFQSGLSWLTILRKRQDFRRVFHGFDYRRVARMGDADVHRLLGDASIVRHRRKIESTINNARKAIDLVQEYGSLGAFFWGFEPPIRPSGIRSETAESRAMAAELKRRGFTWVGPTTAHAFMQAMGIVNDHLPECDVHPEVEDARRRFVRPVPVS